MFFSIDDEIYEETNGDEEEDQAIRKAFGPAVFACELQRRKKQMEKKR